jgi:hypothetical protein
MANPITVIGQRPSQGRVRAKARSGTTWKGFAAGLQPRRQRANGNKQPWSYATTTWRQLSSTERAAWAAIAPAGMSGYALFVQAAVSQAKAGSYAPPGAPATFPTYPPVTNQSFFVTGLRLYAQWDWAGSGNGWLNLQVTAPRRITQLYAPPKSYQFLLRAHAADSPQNVELAFEDQFGYYPSQCYVIALWTVYDGDSGITVNHRTTQEHLPLIIP